MKQSWVVIKETNMVGLLFENLTLCIRILTPKGNDKNGKQITNFSLVLSLQWLPALWAICKAQLSNRVKKTFTRSLLYGVWPLKLYLQVHAICRHTSITMTNMIVVTNSMDQMYLVCQWSFLICKEKFYFKCHFLCRF